MALLDTFLNYLSGWIRPYYSEIALTILATVLVVYGDVLNKQIKRILRPYHFILRTLAFVLICAFGYGLLIVFLSPLVEKLLLMLPAMYRGICVVTCFLILGYLAEKRRYI